MTPEEIDAEIEATLAEIERDKRPVEKGKKYEKPERPERYKGPWK